MSHFKKAVVAAMFAVSMTTDAMAEEEKTQQDRIVIFEKEQVALVNPFVRKAKKGQNSAAFVKVQNRCGVSCRIVKATSPVAHIVELHTSFEDNGVHKMRPVEFIDLAGKTETNAGEVELKSGGYHVMLIDLTQDLEVGTEIPVTLEMSNGNLLSAFYKVKGCCGHCHGPSK